MTRFYIPIKKGKKQLPDFSPIISIGGNRTLTRTFMACTHLKGSVSFPNLTTVNGSYTLQETFSTCGNITEISFPLLTTINGTSSFYETFYRCTALSVVSFPVLASVGNNDLSFTFESCSELTTASFPSLNSISAYALRYCFYNCTSLTSLSFPALTSTSFGEYNNQFANMLQGVTGCTVHFPSNLQSVIGSWSDVTSGFRGTNTTVLFDLPATS